VQINNYLITPHSPHVREGQGIAPEDFAEEELKGLHYASH
jgi:hypothetical protein